MSPPYNNGARSSSLAGIAAPAPTHRVLQSSTYDPATGTITLTWEEEAPAPELDAQQIADAARAELAGVVVGGLLPVRWEVRVTDPLDYSFFMFGPRVLLRVWADVPERESGDPVPVGTTVRLTAAEVGRVRDKFRDLARDLYLHELDEQLLDGGVRPYDPHVPIRITFRDVAFPTKDDKK